MSSQEKAPLFDALYEYCLDEFTSFDVPGHKQGKYDNKLNKLLGFAARMDVNSMPELDLLYHPTGIIDEAQKLMAQSYNVDHAYFLINGTTIGIVAMIYATVKENDKILLPRNVHKSVISAIILTGAIPIFIEPEYDNEWLIMNGIRLDDIKLKLNEHPDIKAILIINPTYFGIMSDYENIIKFCKEKGIITLVDQAHGAHLVYYPEYKNNFKGDFMAISTHKTMGSMSQSSVLLHNDHNISHETLLKSLTMFQSSSASYLLMASLDETRRDIYVNKLDKFDEVRKMVVKYRDILNNIDGISCMDETYLTNDYRKNLDPLKITIKVNELGLSGFEVYKILKKEYGIQMELAEIYTVLAIISIADDETTLSNLVNALQDISSKYYGNKVFEVDLPIHKELDMKFTPKEAFHKEKVKVNIDEAIGMVSGNTIMIYPPGIPICMPGEVIDAHVIGLIKFYNKQTNFTISECDDNKIEIIKESV